jgi:integrase
MKGHKFDLNGDEWKLSSKMTIRPVTLRNILRPYPTLLEGAIRTLAWYAENKSGMTAEIIRHILGEMIEKFPPKLDLIEPHVLVGFRQFILDRDGNDNGGMVKIRPYLCKWHALGFPGISDSALQAIKGWKLKSAEKYARVNRRDPNGGPLEPEEQNALRIGALRAYERGEISTAWYAQYVLLDYTGRRPEQLIRLKWKDLDDTHIEDPLYGDIAPKRLYLLHIPRAKGKRKWREHFRAVPLAYDDWNLLLALRAETSIRFERMLAEAGLTLQPRDLKTLLEELPMFPGWIRLQKSLEECKLLFDRGQHGDAITLLRQDASSDTWEQFSSTLQNSFKSTVEAAGVRNRDGAPIKMFTTRLRYTLESNMYRVGIPPPVRAFNLDHDSIHPLINYSKNSADRASHWSKATLPQMQRLASYFKVQVVDSEADAIAGNDPEQSRLLVANAEAGATCAIKRGCGMGQIPRCCYNGCNHFQPWVDGPHTALLEELLAERDEFITVLDPVRERATIEAADMLILSVAAVILRCEERRRELAEHVAQRPHGRKQK